jgi:hypothetical protein
VDDLKKIPDSGPGDEIGGGSRMGIVLIFRVGIHYTVEKIGISRGVRWKPGKPLVEAILRRRGSR